MRLNDKSQTNCADWVTSNNRIKQAPSDPPNLTPDLAEPRLHDRGGLDSMAGGVDSGMALREPDRNGHRSLYALGIQIHFEPKSH